MTSTDAGAADANVEMNRKKKAAVLGCFTADAAAMPLHWIYDNAKLRSIIGDSEPLFFETLSCPFYNGRAPDDDNKDKGFPGHYEFGQLSPYGEQAVALLTFLNEASSLSPIDGDVWAGAFYTWCKSFTGRPDHAMKAFIENTEAGKKYPDVGADDNQAQSFGKIASVLWASQDEYFLTNVEVAVRAHQNNELNVAVALFWARLLEGVVGGATIKAAYQLSKGTVTHDVLLTVLNRTEANLDNTAYDMLMEYGKEVNPKWALTGIACPNPQATMGALHVVLHASSFKQGVSENCMIGGDTCSRATIIGAVLGAAYGVPGEYTAKVKVPELAWFFE